MKDVITLLYFLGIKIARNNEGNTLNHHKYDLDLISKTELAEARPIKTPMETNVRFTSIEYDQKFNQKQDDPLLTYITSYKCLIGNLFYVTITRLDISYSVQQLSQYMYKRNNLI